jgi:hypothetical protein
VDGAFSGGPIAPQSEAAEGGVFGVWWTVAGRMQPVNQSLTASAEDSMHSGWLMGWVGILILAG